jgi:hypothetical protein
MEIPKMSNQYEARPASTENAIVEVGITKVDMRAAVRKFSEVLEEIAPQGVNVKIAEMVDQTIIVRSVRFFNGRFGPAAFVIFTDLNGELMNMIVGNKIVLPKLLIVREQLPVECKLVKKEGGSANAYFDIE